MFIYIVYYSKSDLFVLFDGNVQDCSFELILCLHDDRQKKEMEVHRHTYQLYKVNIYNIIKLSFE